MNAITAFSHKNISTLTPRMRKPFRIASIKKWHLNGGIGFTAVYLALLQISACLDETSTPRAVSQTPRNYDEGLFSFLESNEEISCQSIPELLSNDDLHPSKVNSIRRRLMIEDPSCFQSHIELFGQMFQSRIKEKHVMLHIPKTGGTSICQSVQEEGILANPEGNCWKEEFCPYWSGCSDPQPTTCAQLKGWYADFVMNENWLDSYCKHHTYSIVMREPVARTMSHINHFLDAIAARGDEHFAETKNWRLSLIQWNYMTWALSASREIDMGGSKRFTPEENHLKFAMKRLMKMDYIIDLNHQDEYCRDYLFQAMKIKNTIGHSNSGYAGYADDFPQKSIEATNSLDIELYNFATKLINLDCHFLRLSLGVEGSDDMQVLDTKN